MSVEAACVEDERFPRPRVNPRIRVPKVAVHERGFQRPAVALKWAQKTRYDLIEERWNQRIKFGIRSLGFEFEIESPPHALRKVSLPACFPLIVLGQIAGIRCHMEAEFVLRGLAVLVERCQLGGESVRVGHFVDHLSEFAQEEVRVRYGFVRSPGYRLRREVRQECVD